MINDKRNYRGWRVSSYLVAALAAAGVLGFGCAPGASKAPEANPGTDQEAVLALNGMGDNGFADNGFDDNGMADNGLADNGLRARSLNLAEFDSAGFDTWIKGQLRTSADPEDLNLSQQRSVVMGYIVKCALSRTDTLSWTGTVAGNSVSYSWTGNLALLPQWTTSGYVLNQSEQEMLHACLGAHVNSQGVSVPISVRGDGIFMDSGEAALYTFREGAYWAYTGADGLVYSVGCHSFSNTTLPNPLYWLGQDSRSCGRVPGSCGHIASIGECGTVTGTACTKDAQNNYHCSVNGVPKYTITVALKPIGS
jgi:hypothetical protein